MNRIRSGISTTGGMDSDTWRNSRAVPFLPPSPGNPVARPGMVGSRRHVHGLQGWGGFNALVVLKGLLAAADGAADLIKASRTQ